MDEEQLFPISVLDRMGGNELTLRHEGGRLNMRKNFLDAGVFGFQSELPRCSSSGQGLFWPRIFMCGSTGCVEGWLRSPTLSKLGSP